jgi:hypothetical protein
MHSGQALSKKAPTKAEREYMGLVASMGCVICQRPAECHHITSGVGMSQKASNMDVIPLCPDHHRNGGYGVAIHAGKKGWEKIHGPELDWLKFVQDRNQG